MENSDRLALGLFAALLRLVPQDGSGGETMARLTLRSAEGDFLGELKLPEAPIEVLTDDIHAMVNYVSAQKPGSLDNPYADIVDEHSFRDPELEAAVDAVFAESEQGELGHWDREVMAAAVSGEPGALRDLVQQEPTQAPGADDDLPLPGTITMDSVEWFGKGHITVDRSEAEDDR
jgi:hypothetical protein